MAIEDYVIAALKRKLAEERVAIAEKFPRNLEEREYWKHVGRHEATEAFARMLQETIAKANAMTEGETDDTDEA